ncbi:acyltransferase family protein [Gluconacetobacter entanii]|uniref:Acyltransferase n=1 Tax=Gluconacetobacter entanii TaxID=108528 RepID=A0A318Q9W4_9PROT|nr:acyltransferase [Gluconacetobacter entanii]MCE2578802.1 acyltransferase [Komagataeibacter sp. FNDCR1]PYD62707.1 acyltransferase [Gluconacetobacter entanii]
MQQMTAIMPARRKWRDGLREEFFPRDRRRDIDGLRALAVAAVVLMHAGWLSGGFVGVDIFVVISGYFMGRSALMQDPFQPARFACRRLYRLLPALLCMVAVISAGMLWWVLQSDRADIALNGAYALVYLSNIWAAGHVGYFEGQALAYPFLHTWSLSLEMQFYAVIFVVAVMLPRVRWRLYALLGILAVSAGCSLHDHLAGDGQGYYRITDRMWEFALGTLIWMLPRPRLPRAVANVAYALALCVLVGACVFYVRDYACPSWGVVFPCLAVVAIIMLPHTDVARVTLGPVSPLGVISYSVYLWHWPVIVLANYLLMFQVAGLTMAGVLVVALLVGLLSYVFVERTFLDYEGRAGTVARNRGALALVCACGLLSAGLGYVSYTSRVH